MDEETQTLLTQWKMDDYIELFKEKPESNQSGVAVENAKEFSDVSDFILNINNKTCLWETTRLLPQQKKRVQKVWSNKQKVIIIVSSALTYYLESVSSDNALFEFEDSSDLLQWLENCTDPWDTVESHWIRTAGTRLKLVKNTNAPASVYINKYPALKTNRVSRSDRGAWGRPHTRAWHVTRRRAPPAHACDAVVKYTQCVLNNGITSLAIATADKGYKLPHCDCDFAVIKSFKPTILDFVTALGNGQHRQLHRPALRRRERQDCPLIFAKKKKGLSREA
ncbi:hypothetical protein EVAR_29073_1 [Eumeta japonica]|uniref:Uncharacterized protein n=1 Tax=Eumeta variegata TaxID=151549 RepID=A0A4C1VMC9_EUMVA|nr:hypothetical protein EVAR_29073_1 [Eumeta japonica]